MAAYAGVARRDDVPSTVSPRCHDALDRGRREVRAVGEDDDRRVGVVAERGEPAAKRRSRAPLPAGTVDDALADVGQGVRAGDDDDLADPLRRPHTVEDAGQEKRLLRRAEPACRARSEHNRADHVVIVAGRDPLSMARVRYMVIETFVHGARPVYERAAARGRMLPPGLVYVESWVDERLDRCFQLVETDDPGVLDEWTAEWSDLVRFEIVPVLGSSEAAARVLGADASR
jgi:hypothetical protein